eukprot:883754-Pyramimonas_sp.AAC.1
MGEGSNAPNQQSTHTWHDLTVAPGASAGEDSDAPTKQTKKSCAAARPRHFARAGAEARARV